MPPGRPPLEMGGDSLLSWHDLRGGDRQPYNDPQWGLSWLLVPVEMKEYTGPCLVVFTPPFISGHLATWATSSTRATVPRATVQPLRTTLKGQLESIADLYSLPTTDGLSLYLEKDPAGNAGPRIGEAVWQALWSSYLNGDRRHVPDETHDGYWPSFDRFHRCWTDPIRSPGGHQRALSAPLEQESIASSRAPVRRRWSGDVVKASSSLSNAPGALLSACCGQDKLAFVVGRLECRFD
ncbi:hypothetical protein BDZ90DRAFT_127651 [Jaminaea rosea]|uniref:Uncharacterized protein n=1 Tax=Jaminaea rosea TaxID=1569628 RepID=A0A316UGG0_9BASI|nr:hypothetical protein BDZ90DRAFT_127651 [Jaminaea rosea]PWN24352.1 hypothetical protein BDZ90DRAFT_127651 [Jaminaea rosea]